MEALYENFPKIAKIETYMTTSRISYLYHPMSLKKSKLRYLSGVARWGSGGSES